MNEDRFLAAYDQAKFDVPLLCVDAILFTSHQACLKVLLVKRATHPERGKWGLPGGFIDVQKDHDLEAAVIRKLREKTGVKPPYIEQLATFGNNYRDRRGWSVTVCYSALIAHQACTVSIDAVADARWLAVETLESKTLAFDHHQIIEVARERLRQKALYSIIPAYALPEKFTLSELQQVHELLIGKKIQKKSFRRRVDQADLLIDTGEKRADRGRPAALYTLKRTSDTYTFLRNLSA